ncbi:MAG: stage III sporulation protein AC [Clostridia bacterium]|nr:stage III sporulation protein AC [Clostridia bacterium]
MNVEILFKIAAVGILITVICQILKKSEREDIATLVAIAGLIIVFTMVITMIAEFFENIKALFNFY